MGKIIFGTVFIIVTVVVNGCGGNGSQESKDYSGNYDISISSTSSHDRNGGKCQDAVGILNINNRSVTGKVLTGHGDTLDLSGSISAVGSVSGGFAVGDFSVATYEGKISGDNGVGEWKDLYNCYGKWTATKK